MVDSEKCCVRVKALFAGALRWSSFSSSIVSAARVRDDCLILPIKRVIGTAITLIYDVLIDFSDPRADLILIG
jgi:hypothetical protein